MEKLIGFAAAWILLDAVLIGLWIARTHLVTRESRRQRERLEEWKRSRSL